MEKRLPSIRALAVLLAGATSLSGFAYTYVVRNHDTLSEIVHRELDGKVFGRNGNLAKVLRLNPGIADRDRIFPGQKIVLESERAPASATTPPVAHAETPPSSSSPSPLVFERGSNFSLAPSFWITSISGTDRGTGSQATIASNLYLRLDGRYFQHWTPGFRTFAGLTLAYLDLEKPTDSRKSLEGTGKLLSGLSVGAAIDFGDRLKFEGTFADEKELYLRALSTTSTAVDTVSVPTVRARFGYDLIDRSPFVFGVNVESSLLFPVHSEGYDTRLGTRSGGALYLQDGPRYRTSLGFYRRNQNTTIVDQSETDLALSVEVTLGGASK